MVEYNIKWLKERGFFEKEIPLKIEGREIIVDSDNLLAYAEVSSNEEITIRKDDNIDSSTIGIMSDKCAKDLKKELIEKLKNPEVKLKVILEVRPV